MGLRTWIETVIKVRREPARPATFEPPPHTAPLVVPAQGEVYDLHITVRLKWRCESISEADLQRFATELRAGALNKVGRIVWERARSLSPFDPARAESILNGYQPIADGICYPVKRHLIRCSPSVQVQMDPRLRTLLLSFETERVQLTERNRLGLLRDKQACERTEAWLHAIQSLEQFPQLGKDERQFLLPRAAQLADKDFAEVIQQMAHDRRVRYDELSDVLDRTRREHERVGLFEFASAYDKALQTFCRQAGISPASFLLSDFGEPKETEGSGA